MSVEPWQYKYGRVKIWLRGGERSDGSPGHIFIFLIVRDVPTKNEDGSWNLDIVEGTGHGDTIGYIDWSEVVAVTWRAPLTQDVPL